MSRYKELAWSKTSSNSNANLDAMEEDMQEALFYIAHKGPIVELDPQILQESRARWPRCLIGLFLDDRSFSLTCMQAVLRHAWHLRSDFEVIKKSGSFYVVQFDNEDDREYTYTNGPWLVQGALLVFVH